MTRAHFRFYAELNDFLPPGRRGREFASDCARAATSKHMIEALGVPHTEVDLVLINGELSGFDRLLADGDRLAAYPRFHRLGLVQRVRTPFADRPRFVADAHLGGLARLLRMLGYDTLYDNAYHDDDIERTAFGAARIVLTRDRALLMRATIVHGCYVRAIKAEAQLTEVIQRYDLAADAAPFSLCLHCNAPLRPITKAEVRDQLPPMVRARHAAFRTCDVCHRVFWQGSHWERMRALLERAMPA